MGPGIGYSYAYEINDSGQVVGTYSHGDSMFSDSFTSYFYSHDLVVTDFSLLSPVVAAGWGARSVYD